MTSIYFNLLLIVAFLATILHHTTADLITLPSFDEFSSTCVFDGIDYKNQVSDQAYQPRGKSDNCAALCEAEQLFNCEAFTWAGRGSHCVLHGKISRKFISTKQGSKYSLTDVSCQKGEGVSILHLCAYEDREVSIAAPGGHKTFGKLTRGDCQLQCEIDVMGNCSSYGFDETVPFQKGTNCITFNRHSSVSQLEEGPYRLYENRCRIL